MSQGIYSLVDEWVGENLSLPLPIHQLLPLRFGSSTTSGSEGEGATIRKFRSTIILFLSKLILALL